MCKPHVTKKLKLHCWHWHTKAFCLAKVEVKKIVVLKAILSF